MLDKIYDPSAVEASTMAFWEAEGLFQPEQSPSHAPGNGQPYSIVMPPPNVTGVLHMGHALDNTIQDILARFHRMRGFTVLWMPGTDHAGIATQSIVERQLAAEKTDRHALGRDAFLERTWSWAKQCQGNITGQLKRLGVSPDWSRQRFTLDDGCSQAVRQAFATLYSQGLIYQGEYIVNWDPVSQSAISDIETEYTDEESFLWHIAYPVEGSTERLTVATTRPETLCGDVALAVHPEDARYQALIGKHVRHPLTQKLIPIVGDDYVEPDFGTGVLKVTPAHDINDFAIGQRHRLSSPRVINDLGQIESFDFIPMALHGIDRFEAKAITEQLLEAAGFLVKKETHTNRVGRAQRSGAIIEPILSKQWFVKTKPLADMALAALEAGEIRFIPERWTKDYLRWMTTIQDWCISRQLWWGHRIPAWHCADCHAVTVPQGPNNTDPTACATCHSSAIEQDPDVLDTWFSSGLWPFSTMGWPNEQAVDFKTFYPTSVLVTGFDIIFFWVARMTMMGHGLTAKSPFHTVYIHGLIRDEKGQKMSKSKGNTVDPVEAIEQYGCDGFRYALTSLITYGGQDIKLAKGVMEQGRLFTNKLWNAARFVLMNLLPEEDKGSPVDNDPIDRAALQPMDGWVLSRAHHTIQEATQLLVDYKFGEAADTIQQFVWNDVCDWYVEYAKAPLRNENQRANTQRILLFLLDTFLRLLHPMMPLMTEAIWQQLPYRQGKSISIAQWPLVDQSLLNSVLETEVGLAIEAIRALRNIRQQYNVPPKQAVAVVVNASDSGEKAVFERYADLIRQFVAMESLTFAENVPAQVAMNLVGTTQWCVPLAGLIDTTQESARLRKKLETLQAEQAQLNGMMSNEGFLARAPESVIAKNRGRLTELTEQMASLEGQLVSMV
ncbi:MAG: valine--tRNA ligase [Vampirovibrionales bacterium]|nr:valine--tRNA ligase [Vampirovibrionales bacterium]